MPTGTKSPFMGSVTASATAASVFTLLSAVWSDLQSSCQYLIVQLDPGAGATALYIGNSNVSSTMCGSSIVATQAPVIMGGDSNLISLRDVFLRTSTGEAQVNLIVLSR